MSKTGRVVFRGGLSGFALHGTRAYVEMVLEVTCAIKKQVTFAEILHQCKRALTKLGPSLNIHHC